MSRVLFVLFCFLTSFVRNTLSTDLNVATYNVFNFPGEDSNDARRGLKEKHFADILEEESVDVVCLQEINLFISDMEEYIYDDNKLSKAYPHTFSIIDTLTKEDKELFQKPCSKKQKIALKSECVKQNCRSLFEEDIASFGFCVALFCPEEAQLLQRTPCIACLAGVSITPIGLGAATQLCRKPIPFNFLFTGGLIMLSKYPLLDPEIYPLPTSVDFPRYLLTADIEIDNKRISVGCTHLISPTSYTKNNIPFVTLDKEVIDAGIDSYQGLLDLEIETIDEIFDGPKYKNNPKILMGDFNAYVSGEPIEAAFTEEFDIFIQNQWNPITLSADNLDYDCTFCNRLENDNSDDNICNSLNSQVNPLIDSPDEPFQILIDNVLLKDFDGSKGIYSPSQNVERFMEDCYNYRVDGKKRVTPLSDHYGTIGRLSLQMD